MCALASQMDALRQEAEEREAGALELWRAKADDSAKVLNEARAETRDLRARLVESMQVRVFKSERCFAILIGFVVRLHDFNRSAGMHQLVWSLEFRVRGALTLCAR